MTIHLRAATRPVAPAASSDRLPWWRVPLSARTWRRTGYALLALPVGVASVPLALLGRAGTAARWQRGLANGLLGLGLGELPRSPRRRALAHALLGLPLSAASFAVAAYGSWIVLLSVAYPLRPYLGLGLAHFEAAHYRFDQPVDAWGGPTLVGAWAVHAALALLLVCPVVAWGVTALTGLQGRLARRLLGGSQALG